MSDPRLAMKRLKRPRGRPEGICNVDVICEDALYFALRRYPRLGGKAETAAYLARAIVDTDRWEATLGEQDGYSCISFNPRQNLGDHQFRGWIHYATQRRNGVHGPSYSQKQLIDMAVWQTIVLKMLRARTIAQIFMLGEFLESRNWKKPVVSTLMMVSGAELFVRDNRQKISRSSA